jgi:hypothetical protein
VTFLHHGRVVWSTTVHGTEAGSDAHGEGKVGVSWRAPSRGRYRVRVSQTGSVYKVLTARRHFRVH